MLNFLVILEAKIVQGVSKLLLQTSGGYRGDLVDKVLIRNPCPETYHFDVK